jgi:dipeptidyl-peptidase-4
MKVQIAFGIALLCTAAHAGSRTADADLEFLQDFTETRGWSLGQPTQVRLTPDGSTVLFLRSLARKPVMRLYAFDVASGQERELITPEQVLAGKEETLSPEEAARRERMRVTTRGFTSYDLSEDGKLVLVTLSGRAFAVPISTGASREVARPSEKDEPIFDPRLSPDGRSVSFVRGGELWVAPVAGGAEKQLTSGATPSRTHAVAEFVAQEELDRFTGYWWSPDSRFLVYEEADLSGVEKLWFGDLANPATPIEPTYYPRPGKANAKISFGVIAATGGKTTWIDWDKKRFEYVPRVTWKKGSPLTLVLLTREQRDLSLVQVDPQSGKTRELLSEHDAAWLNADRHGDYQWLRDGSGFLWATERTGAWQLELRKPDGALVRQLTPDGVGFDGLGHVDLAQRRVYIEWAPAPVEDQVASISLDGGAPSLLTKGPDSHAMTFARDAQAHVVRTFGLKGAPGMEVIRADGSSAGELKSVAEKAPFEANVELSEVGPDKFWTAIVRPHDFDARKKYPVIHSVYGGPHTNNVIARGRRYLVDQWVANHGYIVVFSDGHGTPGRGRAWERTMLNAFAEVPVRDQVIALRAMAQKEPAMDLARVGVIGHSFGGFEAALSVMKHPEVYKAAVAGGTVVDWMNYDTAYTERYLGIPPPAGKSEAYEKNGLLPYAKDLTRPIFLIHGTADDNVHFSETLLLSDSLFREGKDFELLPMVGQTHLFHEPKSQARYWQKIFRFFNESLGAGAQQTAAAQ